MSQDLMGGKSTGLILGLCPASKRLLQSNAISHWLATNLESALVYIGSGNVVRHQAIACINADLLSGCWNKYFSEI